MHELLLELTKLLLRTQVTAGGMVLCSRGMTNKTTTITTTSIGSTGRCRRQLELGQRPLRPVRRRLHGRGGRQ